MFMKKYRTYRGGTMVLLYLESTKKVQYLILLIFYVIPNI